MILIDIDGVSKKHDVQPYTCAQNVVTGKPVYLHHSCWQVAEYVRSLLLLLVVLLAIAAAIAACGTSAGNAQQQVDGMQMA